MEKDLFQTVFASMNQAKDGNYYTWLSEFLDLIVIEFKFLEYIKEISCQEIWDK